MFVSYFNVGYIYFSHYPVTCFPNFTTNLKIQRLSVREIVSDQTFARGIQWIIFTPEYISQLLGAQQYLGIIFTPRCTLSLPLQGDHSPQLEF